MLLAVTYVMLITYVIIYVIYVIAKYHLDPSSRLGTCVIGMEVGLSQGDFVIDGDAASLPLPPKFSVHVYYSHCDFVRILHSRYWFVQVQVQVLVFYAFCF